VPDRRDPVDGLQKLLIMNSLIVQHTEEDKSPACASKTRSFSDQSDDFQSPPRSAIEGDISTAESNGADFLSDTDHSHRSECQDQEQAGSNESTNHGTTLTEEAAQQQLEMMSQVVMEAWAKLQALEAELSRDTPASTSTPNGLSSETVGEAAIETEQAQNRRQQQHCRLEALNEAGDAATKEQRTHTGRSSSLDVKSHLGAGPIGHTETVLASAKKVLDSTPGVVGTSIVLGIAGNIATLFIDMSPSAQETTRLSVTAISKAALLEAAASTQSVYILGYEATPFEDIVGSTGFAGTLAITPNTCQFRACWGTLKKGFCPRGAKCKWWHPGRDEIQPIQVVVRSGT